MHPFYGGTRHAGALDLLRQRIDDPELTLQERIEANDQGSFEDYVARYYA